MSWRYSEAGKAIDRPSSEHGLHVDGPLTAKDWKYILDDIIEEMVEQSEERGEVSVRRLLEEALAKGVK